MFCMPKVRFWNRRTSTKPCVPENHRSRSRPYADGADPITGPNIGVSALSGRGATVTHSDQWIIRRPPQILRSTSRLAGLDKPHSTSTSPINAIGLWLPLIGSSKVVKSLRKVKEKWLKHGGGCAVRPVEGTMQWLHLLGCVRTVTKGCVEGGALPVSMNSKL